MARKVAIVEDDFDQRENYRDALAQSGYEVTTYRNRQEALTGMRTDMPMVVLIYVAIYERYPLLCQLFF